MNWVSDDEFETARLTVENCVWSIAAAQEAVDADPRVAEWFSRYIKQKRLEMVRATRRLHELGPWAPASDDVMREHEVRLGLPEGTFTRTFREPGRDDSLGLGRTLELAEHLAEAELEVSGLPWPDWGPAIIRICCGTLIGALVGAPLGALAVQENVLKKMIEAAVVGGITAVANELVGPLSERAARLPDPEPERVAEPEPVPPPERQVEREPLRERELVQDPEQVEELDPQPARQVDPPPVAERMPEPVPEAELAREPVRESAREVEPALAADFELEVEPGREPARELVRESEALVREVELELAREPEPVGELEPEPVRDPEPELALVREAEELVHEAEPDPVREQERELELTLVEEQELVRESEPMRDPELEQEPDIDPPDFELFRGF